MKKIISAFFIGLLSLVSLPVLAGERPDLLEIIEISGEIDGGTSNMINTTVETINENPTVKAVLLIVKSPGGGVLASADVYHALAKLKVPVVGWCSGMCASGGMYALMSPSVKYIGVSDETIAGSIGVVMQVMKFNRLLDYLKVDALTYKSGELKVAGSPVSAGTPAEDKYLQSLVNDFATSFYEKVEKARKITDWPAVKSARIFIGQEAVKVGLVDKVMSRQEALDKAKQLSKAKAIYTREELKKMSAVADRHSFTTPVLPIKMVTEQPYGDIPYLINSLKDIMKGETVKFMYRLPLEF